MPRPIRLLVALLTLVLTATGIAACGGGGNASSSGDASALLKDTFGANHPIKSGKLDLALDLDVKGLPRLSQPIAIRLNGPFQSNGPGKLPNFAFALDLASGSNPVSLGAISTGTNGYLSIEGQQFAMGSDLYASFKKGYADSQSKSDNKTATPSLQALGIRPMRWLRNPHEAGTEDVGGTTTTHLTSDVDVHQLLADVSTLLSKAKALNIAGATTPLSASLTPTERAAIERSVKTAAVDLWTGKDDRTLRKLALNVTLDVPQGERDALGGLRSGRIGFQFTIADLNAPQTITAPKGARPISELQKALQQLAGSASAGSSSSGSSGSSGSGGTTTDPAPSSGPQKQYLDCVQKAGTDVAQIQQCAALLH
jgi:hypothetical protein